MGLGVSVTVGTMETPKNQAKRIQARNAAMQTLNRVTAGVAFVAVAGVGLLGVVSAHTVPGVTSSSQASTTSSSTATTTTP